MTAISYEVPGRPTTWKRTALYRGRRITHAGQRQAQRAHQLYALEARPRGWSLEGDMAVAIVLVVRTKHRFDIDNAAKLVLDALNGIAWRDDSQVCELHVSRQRGDVEGTLVSVRRV